jgi:CRP-like cAMP-binding protein
LSKSGCHSDSDGGTTPRSPRFGLTGAELTRLFHSSPPALLAGITLSGFLAFMERCRTHRFPAAKPILRQGEPTSAAYLVLRGAVEVSFIDNDGNRVLAHLARPGEVVGEVEILSGRPCAATCVALADSLLAAFDLGMVRRALPAETLLHNLAGIFHERLIRDNRQHTVAMFFTSEDRIRMHLLSLTTIDQPCAHISQADLATFCGCSRQTVNRTLAHLRALGIVGLSRGAILIRDRAALEAARLSGHGLGEAPPHEPRGGAGRR